MRPNDTISKEKRIQAKLVQKLQLDREKVMGHSTNHSDRGLVINQKQDRENA